MMQSGIPASPAGPEWGQGGAHKIFSAEPLINGHDREG